MLNTRDATEVLDRDFLDERSGRIHGSLLKDVENGLRLVLDL